MKFYTDPLPEEHMNDAQNLAVKLIFVLFLSNKSLLIPGKLNNMRRTYAFSVSRAFSKFPLDKMGFISFTFISWI